MWALFLPIITSIFGADGLLTTYAKTKAAEKQATADLNMQIQKDKMALSGILAQAAIDSEKNKLAATSQNFKYVTFILINIPVIIICFSPSKGKEIFENIALIPVWYAALYASIYGVIWGLPVAANTMSNIIASIQQAWDIRNQGKINKIQALGEANMITFDQAVKAAYDVQRKLSPNGMLSVQQVEAMRPIIEAEVSKVVAPSASNVNVNTGDNQNV